MKTYLITLSLLILAVIVLRALFRRSVSQRVIYALWIVVLLRICLPFQIFAVEVPNFFVTEDAPQSEITLAPDTTAVPYITETFTPSVTTSSVIIPIPSVTEEPSSPGNIPWESVAPITPVTPSESTESVPSAVTPETPKTEINIPWKTVAYTAWTTGSLIFLLSLGASALSFSRRLKADRRYYMSLGKTKVYVSKAAGSPMLWGLVPVIYLTPDMGKDEAYSLVHEQTHLRHGDHIWSIVRALVLALFWWNPLVWAAVYLSKQDAELACDEAIASRLDDGARLEYAKVIVDNIPRKGTLATGLASAPIKERIIMITRKNKTRAISLLLVLVLTFASVGCSFIGPKSPIPDDTTADHEEQTPPDDGVAVLPEDVTFVGYVESETAEFIDLYTEKDGEKIASIPWNVIADFPATEKSEGWLPYSIWYGEDEDFVWAVVGGGVHLGSDNRNFCFSRDGGTTWEIGEMAATWSGITTSAIFISEDIGFMGYERGAYDGIVIARTEDGGKNWNRVKIEIPTGLADFRGTTPISFTYDGKRLICTVSLTEGVGPDTSVDILSKDNGVTWEYEYNWSGKIGTYHTVISNTGTREAHLIPAAMYGYGVGDGIAYTSYETNTKSYWTTLNAGSDIGFWAVFGMQNDYKAQGDFDGYVTYRISALNGRVVAHDIVETFTKELVLEKGKIYSGELKGTYKAKAFSRGDGLTSYTFLFNNGNIELSAYRAGSGAGGTYNGTYTYDKTSGKLSANLSFTTVENGMTKTSFGHNFTAKVYEYDGFIHFIITDSGLSMMESGAPLPISFKMADRPGDFDMMANILINSALTEKQLAGGAVSDEVIRSFIGYTCVSYYRENGFIYSGYWKLIDNNMTLYMSAEDVARIAYEVFGVENYSGGAISIPYGVGLGSGNGWSAVDTTIEQNSDTVVYRCTLVGDEMNESSEKVFGNYRFTFKYITEGERGFWRYVGAEETKTPETTDVPTVTDPEFEAYMNIKWLSDDAKAYFRVAKEKSGYSIVDRTLTVENGTITVERGRPIDDYYANFRAVYGEGTAEFMEYVEEAMNIGYWEFYPDLLTSHPEAKVKVFYNRGGTFSPITARVFLENNIHDLDSLRAYLKTKFTDKAAEKIMENWGIATDNKEDYKDFAYYEGELYARVGTQGMYSNDFAAEFFLKEKTEDRVSIICRKRVQSGIITLDNVADFEFVFVREGNTWLCDSLPNVWNGTGSLFLTKKPYTESTPDEKDPDTTELLANAVSHKYEEYPGNDRVPYSAVLWRDGVSTNIDANDPRLIMLVNMYNNSMYHLEFAQTSGKLDNATYKKYVDAPVRLELTFERDHSYILNNNVVYNDKIIISCPEGERGGFVVIYFDEETDTPVPEESMIRYPYEMYYMDWLRLVGFVE